MLDNGGTAPPRQVRVLVRLCGQTTRFEHTAPAFRPKVCRASEHADSAVTLQQVALEPPARGAQQSGACRWKQEEYSE